MSELKYPESFGGFYLETGVGEDMIKIVKEKGPISTEMLYRELDYINKETGERMPRYTELFFDYVLRKLSRDYLHYIHTWDYNATIDNQNTWVIDKTFQKILKDEL